MCTYCKLSKLRSPSWLQCYLCVFPLWCWYVRHACQLNASVGWDRRGGWPESWICSATRPKARRPPFTASRRMTWTGFCLTIAQAHLSTDRQMRNVEQRTWKRKNFWHVSAACFLIFLFSVVLQQHAKWIYNFRQYVNVRNCFQKDDFQPFINEGMLFLLPHSSVCWEVLDTGQRSHLFWAVFRYGKFAGTLPLCGHHIAM